MKRLTLLVSAAAVFACLGALPAMAQLPPPTGFAYRQTANDGVAYSVNGGKLLHYVKSGRPTTEIAKFLIDTGADVNEKDEIGWTPLMYAAANGHTETAKLLIDKGANVNAMGNGMETALYAAEFRGHTDIANLLIKHGADKKYYEKRDKYGWTTLMYAAESGHTEIAKFFIDTGADVNAKDIFGITPLMYAAGHGYTEIAKLLVESGANVNYKTTHNVSVIYQNTFGIFSHRRRGLLDIYGPLDKKLGGGLTAAELARESGHEETAKVIEETHKKVQARKQKAVQKQVKKALTKK